MDIKIKELGKLESENINLELLDYKEFLHKGAGEIVYSSDCGGCGNCKGPKCGGGCRSCLGLSNLQYYT